MSRTRMAADEWRWVDPNARGNCLCLPKKPDSKAILDRLGLRGIEHHNGEPDFSVCAVDIVKIPMMTRERFSKGSDKTAADKRDGFKDQTFKGMSDAEVAARIATYLSHHYAIPGNYDQADAMLAAKWTRENRDGHEWTPRMIENYRKVNKLTWNERQDGEHMDLVPEAIHDDFAHLGGTGILMDEYRASHDVSEEYEDHGVYGKMTEEEIDYAIKKHDEILAREEKMEEAARAEKAGQSGGFVTIHIIITLGLVAGIVLSHVLMAPSDLFQNIIWFLAAFGSGAMLVPLCVRCNGLPRVLRSRTGAIIILIYLVVMLALVPVIAMYLFFAIALAVGFFFVKAVGSVQEAFAPKGRIAIHRTDADGNTRVEEKAVYGDMNEALRQTENQLRNEGYDEIKRD